MKKRVLSILLTLVMLIGMMPLAAIPAFAAGDTVSYLDEYGRTQSRAAADVTEITSGGEYGAGWYILYGEKSMGRVTFTGTAYLILADGANITVTDSIVLENADTSLTIYAQPAGTGKLTAAAGQDSTIPGIGSRYNGSCGNITINGGIITAFGGYYGAGIGCGYYGSCGDITINGGVITAYGGYNAAGIGGGYNSTVGDITINGGVITASDGKGGYAGAAIGSGFKGRCGTITINGGIVTATGAGAGAGGGAGGGAGIGAPDEGTCADIMINGGVITAYGGYDTAGIGTGNKGSCGDITINGGAITAYGGYAGAAIGSGFKGRCGTITINGGIVSATGGQGGAGIGSGGFAGCGTITINGGCVKARSNVQRIGAGTQGYCGTVDIVPTCKSDIDGWYCVNIEGFAAAEPTCTEAGHAAYVANCLDGLYYTEPTFTDSTRIGDDAALAAWLAEGGAGFTGAPLGHLDENRDNVCERCSKPVILYYDYAPDLSTMKEQLIPVEDTTEIYGTTSTLTDGWYVVRGSIDVPGGIAVNGDVHLIIADDSVLKVKKGIRLAEGKTLTIYSQSFGSNMGAITVTDVADNCAGIGSGPDNDCEGITINGCRITVTGGMGGAAIGSGAGTDCKNVTINGGTVIVNDGKGGSGALKAGKGGAGIGSGVGGNCICVTINGGYVEARGGKQLDGDPNGGAGIGGGSYGNGGDVYVNGGTVRVYGYSNKTPSFGKPIYEMGSAAVLHVGEGVNAYTLNALEEKDAKLKDDASGIVETYTYYRIIIDSETSSDNDDPVNPLNPIDHTHLGILQPGAAATENSAGFRDYYECPCGKCFEDAACTVEITDLDAWKAKGGNGYLAPLSDKDDPTAPKTGDNSNIALWMTLFVLSSMVLCCCGIIGRKRKNEQ